MKRCIDRDYEAACGDLFDDDIEPVFLTHRSTREDLARLHLRTDGRTLRAVVVWTRDGFALDDVVTLFVRTYLGNFTDDYYRGKVDAVMLEGPGAEPVATFAYPPREVLFG